MSLKKLCVGTLVIAVCTSVSGFATPDAMRAANATQINSKLASSVTLTKDSDANIVSFHVNGVSPSDADILIRKDPSPLSTEFTIITGTTPEGCCSCYMLPTSIATAQVVEAVSKDLVNAGSTNLQITKQLTGKY